MFNIIKKWLLGRVEAALLKEISHLSDKYEPILASIIQDKLNPEERSKQVVDFVQKELMTLVEKAFGWKFLSSALFGKVKASILNEVTKLDNYENDLAAIINKHLNADETAKLVVDYLQNYLTALVKKYIQKI